MTPTEILKSVGYPTEVLVLDFETYYDTEYSLSKMSTIEYVTDKRFEFTGVGLGGEGLFHGTMFKGLDDINKGDPFKILQSLHGSNLEDFTVVVKNAKFDITILAVKFGIIPPYVIDIDDLLRHYDSRMSHKMKDVAPMFGLQPKGDTSQFKGLRYEQMDKEQKEALRVYTLNDIEIETALFKLLLPRLSSPEVEIPLARHTLDLYLNPKIRFDFKKAEQLKQQMQEKIQSIIDCTGLSKKIISGNISFLEELCKALPDGEEVPMKQGKNKRIPALAQTDDGRGLLLAHSDEKVRNLMKARVAVKSWPLHIKRINNLAKQAKVSGGYVRVPLVYYGAHTGRWSGSEKTNLQNLGGRGRTGAGIDPLIGEMRSLLRAPDGSVFIIVDSAQIEARILAWLAGQNDLVKEFADDGDVYSTFASRLFGCKIRKERKDDPGPVQRYLQIKRGFGKDAILGCGYGMGSNTFFTRCRQNSDLRPLFDSGKYNWNFIDKLIKTYRRTYKQIPAFWSTVEKAFKWVTKYQNEKVSYFNIKGNSGIIKCGQSGDLSCVSQLTFYNHNGTVCLQLPSGRILYYRHCRVDGKGTICWHHGKLWGGAITENIVQAVARDLLGWWILYFEEHDLPVVLHSHDEIVSIVPKRLQDARLEFAEYVMRHGPDWAEGLPLNAEGKISGVYTK